MKSIIKEVWKDIYGYEGKYQVSNLGNVRTLKFVNNITEKEKIKILKPQLRNNYLIINLSKRGKRKQYSVHRLVAQTFIANPNNYDIVNHLDFNTLNNCVDNLEWCTQKENVQYSICNMKNKIHLPKKRELYGITYRKRGSPFEVTVMQKYYGKFKTLEEAKRKRDEVLHELNIAI